MKKLLFGVILASLIIAKFLTADLSGAPLSIIVSSFAAATTGSFLLIASALVVFYFSITEGSKFLNRYAMKKRGLNEEQIDRGMELIKRGYSVLRAMRIARNETERDKTNRDAAYDDYGAME